VDTSASSVRRTARRRTSRRIPAGDLKRRSARVDTNYMSPDISAEARSDTRAAQTDIAKPVYQAATWMHVVPILIAMWVGLWEWACVSSAASSATAITWSLVNGAVAAALYLRAKRMGVAAHDSRLVLRHLLFHRAIPWDQVERFGLEPLRGGVSLYLYTANGRRINAPAAQFAAAETKESWLRGHKVVWDGGESSDVLGTLNRVIDDHRGRP